MSNVAEVLEELQKALTDAKKAHEALSKAKATLSPLEEAAKEKDNAVNVLMSQYQSLIGAVPAKGRRGSTGRKYSISNESKIAATGKRAYTRAINAGQNEKDAKKAKSEAEVALAHKLGVGVK